MPTPAVVLDTNVLVAAGFNSRSASARIVDAVKRGRLRMMWNDDTRREIERILRQIPPLRSLDAARLFHPADRYALATHPERFAIVPDPEDRKFAALAHAAGAILVSNDEHLLSHRDRLDVRVLTPAAFVEHVLLPAEPPDERDAPPARPPRRPGNPDAGAPP
ncbi:MAG TPA: PIN domain-containing protein [Gemmatimonadaceae bacterium]|nr:PIN domain-containing protein [Gemmatimonadaceae bacterium]